MDISQSPRRNKLGKLMLTVETLTDRNSDFNRLRIHAEIDRLKRASITHPDETIREACRQRAEFLEKELES
jgi:hypothetical protein